MAKLHKRNNFLRKTAIFTVVMMVLLLPSKMMAKQNIDSTGTTPGLTLAIEGGFGSGIAMRQALSTAGSNTGLNNDPQTLANGNYLLQQALINNNANAQKILDTAQASALANGVQPQLTAEQSLMFGTAAIADKNTWAQGKILDQIKNGKVSPEDIQKLKDAADKNGLSDFKKKIEDAEKNGTQPPKANKDKCVLVTPGMSQKLGTIYGEDGVKAQNDKHQFCDEVQANPLCTTAIGKADCVVPPRLLALPSKAENPTPKYKDIQPIPLEPCVWAVDWAGKPAYSTKGSDGKGQESQDNFKIRTIQTQENVDKYMVTMDKDLGLIKPTGANSEIRQGAKYAGQSNEQINKENAAKGGGNVTLVPSDGPSKDQHQEYYFKSSQNERGYTVGSGNKKMYTGAPYTAGEKATSISAKASGKQDVQVTNSCDFQNNTQQSPQPPGSSGNPWPDNGSGGGSGGSNGGGGEGGGGALGKILPALMQALQGLMGGGGQQGNQGYPTPTPYGATPTPYICPSTHVSDSVCGVNGITYASQCVAEYENQMTVKHAGICTTADTTATSSNSVSTITTLLQQLVSSGLPDSLLSSVIDTVTNLITGVLSNNSSVSQTNVQ
jgi:hypothetical protein